MKATLAKVVEEENPVFPFTGFVYSVEVSSDTNSRSTISIPCQDKAAAEALLQAIHVNAAYGVTTR